MKIKHPFFPDTQSAKIFSGKDGSELEEARSEFAQSMHNGFNWRAQFKQVNHGD
jgi:hypothetical protein